MFYFIILTVVVVLVSYPIFKKFQERKKMTSSLLDNLDGEITQGSYFDREIKFFIDRKTLSTLKHSGTKGFDEDLRQTPEYQVKSNLITAHINKYLLETRDGKTYFSSSFVQFIDNNRRVAYTEAFTNIVDEFYTKRVKEEGGERVKQSVDRLNKAFSEDFDKKFAAAKQQLIANPVISADVEVNDTILKFLKRYAHKETNTLLMSRRIPIRDTYGDFSPAYKTEYSKQYSDLRSVFLNGNKFSNGFVQFASSKYPGATIEDFGKLIPLYLRFLHR